MKQPWLKKLLRWLIIILVIYNVLMLGVGYYFYNLTAHYNKNQGKSLKSREIERKNFDTTRYNALRKLPMQVTSRYGYKLVGELLYCSNSTEQTVIINHGITGDRWAMMKIAEVFLNAGFNTLMYDLRNHGESGGDAVSYGYYEKHDLQDVAAWFRHVHPNARLGMYGESLGGAIALQYAPLDTANVDFYITDAAYSDISQLYNHKLKADYGLPNLLIIQYAGIFTRLFEDYWLWDSSVLSDIDDIKTPILFIHGDADAFTPSSMAQDMYNLKTGEKQLLIVPKAEHAKAFHTDRTLFEQTIIAFMQKYE